MRTELEKRNGKRGEFTAAFERWGRATGWQGKEIVTLLFVDVRDSSGAKVTDHLWFKQIKAFTMLGLKPGDRIKMTCRVKPYHKGYRGRRSSDGWSGTESGEAIDYKLAFPTKVEVINGPAAQPVRQMSLLGEVACPGCGSAVEDGKPCAGCRKRID